LEIFVHAGTHSTGVIYCSYADFATHTAGDARFVFYFDTDGASVWPGCVAAFGAASFRVSDTARGTAGWVVVDHAAAAGGLVGLAAAGQGG
jgi:hypothetical protein